VGFFPDLMHVLFIHGMGRSPLSGWPMLRRLRRGGMQTSTFGYAVTFEDFAAIRDRLARRIQGMSAKGEYVLVGHSLGGVLLRAALNSLPEGTKPPIHVFLLGSPIQSARMARKLSGNPVFRLLAGDCGQLLGSDERMAGVGAIPVATTGVAGVRGLSFKGGPFGDDANDGVVSLSEVSADWMTSQVCIPVVHTLLPSSRQVSEIILQRLALVTGQD